MNRIGRIQKTVADAMEVHMADFLGRTRTPRAVHARHAAMYLIRKLVGCSYPELAVEFDRDHSTVIYAVQRFETDEKLRAGLADIEAACIAEGLAVKGRIQWGAIQDVSGKTEQLSLPLF